MYALGIDCDNWQAVVDFPLLRDKGISFAIIKATTGDYAISPTFVNQANAAMNSGLLMAFYHWCDPLVSPEKQAQKFLANIKGFPALWLGVDVEQYWADWSEWRAAKITKYLSPQAISECAYRIACVLRQAGLPVVIYTRKSFIDEYAKPMLSWIKEFPVWLAHYPVNFKPGPVEWEDLVAKLNLFTDYIGKGVPTLPASCSSWHFWQFTGDQLYLPGAYQDAARTKRAALDLNLFNGSVDDLRKWAGLQLSIPPAPKPRTWEQSITDWARKLGYVGPDPGQT